MMSKLFFPLYCILLLTLMLFTSCRKLIKDEFPDFDQKPVVNSVLIDGQNIKVQVSLAQKMDKEALKGISNAEVFLYCEDILVEKLALLEEGMYSSSCVASAGKNYTLKINIPNFESIEKSIRVPLSEQILSIEHFNHAGMDPNGIIVPALKIVFSNDPNEQKYYQILLKCFNKWDSSVFFAESTEITDPVLLNEGLPILVFSNEKISNDTYSMYIRYTTNSSTNGSMTLHPLVVELRTIDSAYYYYLKSVYLYDRGNSGSSIGEVFPTYPIYSNVEGGYGILSAFSSYSYDTIFPESR